MSRRRAPRRGDSRGTVRVVCTGRGRHRLRTLDQIVDQRWLLAEWAPADSGMRGQPWVRQVLASGRKRPGHPGSRGSTEDRDGRSYAYRFICPDCGIDVVLRQETLGEVLARRYADTPDATGRVVLDVSAL